MLQFDEFSKLNCNLKITRQIDLVLHYFAYECCNLTNFSSFLGMYLLDLGDMFYLYICRGIHSMILERLFGVTRLQDVDETMTELPEKDNDESDRLRVFISWLNASKPYPAPIQIIR